jgi:predicted phosphodiesterase
VVSDLHLGNLLGTDLVSAPAYRTRLLEALEGADRVVLLGDVIEERERPVAELLEVTASFFDDLAEVTAGARVTIVPGNHDHGLAEPWLARLRLEGRELGAAEEWAVEPGEGAAGRIAARLADSELTVAYPGLWLRPGVYATHGHFLDLHLTVPRLESIAASAVSRMSGRGSACASAADYEAVMAPLYVFFAELAQGASPKALARGGRTSREVWRRVNGGGRLGRVLLGRMTIPGAVAALNRLGIGPFRPLLTGEELRRSGLLSMSRVAETLAPGAEHVLFGHTHRPGPLPGDDPAEWTTLSGIRLMNSGCWMLEGAFLRDHGERSPYWPGTVLLLDDDGPPRLVNALRDVSLQPA